MATPFGKIKQSELDKFFSKYGDASALESAFTTSPDMNIAARNFNNNWRQPGMAEEPIPGAPPTDLSKRLEPAPWLVNMAGEGPTRPQNPASLQTWMKKQAETEIQQAKEQKAMLVLFGSNPTRFIGRPVDSFTNLKDMQAYLKLQIDSEFKEKKLSADIVKANKDRQVKIDAAGGRKWNLNASTGTVTGGGVAPSDTKVVAEKTFRRVNGSWVQQ